MTEYIYTERNNQYRKLKFHKETKTQIVAHGLLNPDYLYRFNKETGKEKGGDQWYRRMTIITAEAYRVGRNALIDAEIATQDKEIDRIKIRIEKLRKSLVL